MLVEAFKRDNPSYVSTHKGKRILDETAYFLQKTKLDPDSYFQTPFGNVSKSITKPLHIVYERAVAQEEPSRQAELEAVYEESMRLLLNEPPSEPSSAPYSPFVPATPTPP